MKQRWRLFAIIAIVNFVADQLTKWWAKSALPETGQPVAFIENFWDWQLSFNQGSAFGLFHGIGGARIFLTIIGLVALVAVGFMVKSAGEKQIKMLWGLGMVAGGAVGNIIDRVLHGSVTDFVVWKYYDTAWPTFNVADVSLVVGVGLMILDMKNAPEEEKEGEEESKPAKPSSKSKKKTSSSTTAKTKRAKKKKR